MASKYLYSVSNVGSRGAGQRILFRLLVQLLGLLLELGEAPLGVYVDRIFCDLALEKIRHVADEGG
jgi:hypothetical protein